MTALLYHDIVEPGEPDASGLPGPGAAVYKLDAGAFEDHLDALAGLGRAPVGRLGEGDGHVRGWMLTFDDGGASAAAIGERLARRAWVGHFFITAGRIGERGFVTEADVRGLVAGGHEVGSHSWSHPARMSGLPPGRIREEWARSVDRLSAIVGSPIRSASVPGGFYSGAVARAAADAGIRWLFTSEPRAESWRAGGCLVLGRLSVQRDTTPAAAAALASGAYPPRLRLWLAWNARKLAKRAAGPWYERGREAVLRRLERVDRR